jgi:hypothetical protein
MRRFWKLALIPVILVAANCETGTDSAGNRITSVTIATPAVVLSQAETQVLGVTIRDADGNVMQDVSGVTWTSSNQSVVSVTPGGQIRGVSLGGPATVTVSVSGKSATTSVTVIPARIGFSPNDSTLALGQTRQLNGILLDYENAPISSGAPITWSSSNPNVATIGASSGLVTSVAAGETIISATAAGRTSTALLMVGVPSPYDGLWSGLSAAVGPTPLRGSMTSSFNVVFGQVRNFRLTWVMSTPTCAVNIAAAAAPTPINDGSVTLLVVPPPNATQTPSPAIVNATFTSPTTMTATQSAMSFGSQNCTVSSGISVTDGGHPAATITATKAPPVQ